MIRHQCKAAQSGNRVDGQWRSDIKPMRRKRPAARRRTLQQVAAAFIAQNFDLPAAEYPLAQNTKTFIVKRRPGSKLIAGPQDLEAFVGCEITLHNPEKKPIISANNQATF